MAITSERVEFPAHNGQLLAARLDRPSGPPAAYALFAHCFTCSKDVFAAARISTALAEQGYGVLRFDFTGLGGSQGDFANTNFSSNVQDLVAAADFLRKTHQPPALLIGHSLGGAAVLAAAGKIAEARAVATINAPCDPAHVSHLLKGGLAQINAQGEAEVEIGGRGFRIQRQFLEDIAEQNMQRCIKSMRKALLVMHTPQDQVVGIENAGRIFGAALHPKSFIALDGADHLLTDRADAAYAASVLGAWAAPYALDPTTQLVPPKAAPGEVVVAETAEGHYANLIAAGNHVIRADEPQSHGGMDSGMSPYDLLGAALGACTSITLRMYADLKKLELEKVSVRLRHEKIHATDCEECETREGKIDRFEREITLEGNLDAAQRQRLLEIADRCPVHRSLHSEVSVVTRLKD